MKVLTLGSLRDNLTRIRKMRRVAHPTFSSALTVSSLDRLVTKFGWPRRDRLPTSAIPTCTIQFHQFFLPITVSA